MMARPTGQPGIVSRYLDKYRWIELIHMPQRRDRSFAAKVQAFNAGYERVKDLDYEIIGNLDADISFDKDHFEFLTRRFSEDPSLGVAGTSLSGKKPSAQKRTASRGRGTSRVSAKLFRRQCWEEIGGYIHTAPGGIDWMAVTTARMRGWKTQSFREKWFFHYRRLGTAERSVLSSAFSYGGRKTTTSVGIRSGNCSEFTYRAAKRPYIAGGLGFGPGLLFGLSAPNTSPRIAGTDGFPPQGANG